MIKTKPRVIIESPYARAIARNTEYARRALHDSLLRGEAPFAIHLIYTQSGVLDDLKPEERQLGIEAGSTWWLWADLVAFYIDYGVSPGMLKALDRARELGVKFEYREIGRNEGD